jgi:hypothetical protein
MQYLSKFSQGFFQVPQYFNAVGLIFKNFGFDLVKSSDLDDLKIMI